MHAWMDALRMVSKNKILCFINTFLFIIKNRGTGCLPWSCILEFGIGLQEKNERCFVCTTECQDGHLAHAQGVCNNNSRHKESVLSGYPQGN